MMNRKRFIIRYQKRRIEESKKMKRALICLKTDTNEEDDDKPEEYDLEV